MGRRQGTQFYDNQRQKEDLIVRVEFLDASLQIRYSTVIEMCDNGMSKQPQNFVI